MTGQASGSERLLISADRLSRALEEHAHSLVEDPDGRMRTNSALNELRAAAWEYVSAVIDGTKWGNPFASLEDENTEGVDDGARKGAGSGRAAAGQAVKLDVVYRLGVKDMRSARALVADLYRIRGQGVWGDALDSPADVITALFFLDGWKPSAYDQGIVEFLDEEWSCGPE